MSHSNLRKKIQPAKKTWKRLCRMFGSKFHNFSFSEAVNVIKSSSKRILSYCSLHVLHLFQKHSITRRPSYFSHHYNFYGSKKQLTNKNVFSPIYIDQLYAAEAESSVQAKKVATYAETSSSGSRGKQVVAVDENVLPGKEDEAKEKVLYNIEDAWREVVAKSPQLRPVDDRAEEFISKFHHDMKIQKEKSILEFQEMLARGV